MYDTLVNKIAMSLVPAPETPFLFYEKFCIFRINLCWFWLNFSYWDTDFGKNLFLRPPFQAKKSAPGTHFWKPGWHIPNIFSNIPPPPSTSGSTFQVLFPILATAIPSAYLQTYVILPSILVSSLMKQHCIHVILPSVSSCSATSQTVSTVLQKLQMVEDPQKYVLWFIVSFLEKILEVIIMFKFMSFICPCTGTIFPTKPMKTDEANYKEEANTRLTITALA